MGLRPPCHQDHTGLGGGDHCAATRTIVDSRSELLLRALSGFMILLQLESVMMPIACVGRRGIEKCAVLSQPCPSLVLG